MTKRAVHSVRLPASVVALCLVLLQLVSSLHFALVPHGFNARLSGLVHLHRAFGAEPGRAATQQAPSRPTLVAGIAACAPDDCPLGFSGHSSRPVSPSSLSSLIWLPEANELVAREQLARDRSRALLSAPKTSPPLAV